MRIVRVGGSSARQGGQGSLVQSHASVLIAVVATPATGPSHAPTVLCFSARIVPDRYWGCAEPEAGAPNVLPAADSHVTTDTILDLRVSSAVR